MLYRYSSVILMCSTLVACGDKIERSRGVPVLDMSSVNTAGVAESAMLDEQVASEAKVAAASDISPALDLSLPVGVYGDVPDLSSTDKDRYGVEAWFEQSGANEGQRFKMKAKLRVKEGAEFDKNSDVSSFGDSVDGAEMGFEYKTR
jgi:hypothetical protein